MNLCWCRILWVLLGFVPWVRGESSPARLGTNELAPGRPLSFLVPLNSYARAQTPGLGTNVTVARAVLVLPDDWDSRPVIPIFVVCSPSGSPALPQLAAYTNAVLAEGWAVLAADGPPLPAEKDTVLWNWGLAGSALEYLNRTVPRTRSWPVAVGGFSGGAKRAASVAAAMVQGHRVVRGVFMGGCNEDRATTGALLFGSQASLYSVPMFLSNGTEDRIAGPDHGAAVRASMVRSGFKSVRAETYPGGHRLHPLHVREALRWFASFPATTTR